MLVNLFAACLICGFMDGEKADATPASPIHITPEARQGGVEPHSRREARADGGLIDVRIPTPNSVVVVMSGTVAANAYLGCRSHAEQTFHLVQELDIASSDPAVKQVELTVESSMAGYLRGRYKGSAGTVRLASMSLRPVSWDGTPLQIGHQPIMIEGTQGQLVNIHLPHLEGPPMPLGRYLLVADFSIYAEASGLCDGHAVVDFSPSTALPDNWVRARDAFQGVDKSGFGFAIVVSASPVSTSPFKTTARAPKRVSIDSKTARETRAVAAKTDLPPLPVEFSNTKSFNQDAFDKNVLKSATTRSFH